MPFVSNVPIHAHPLPTEVEAGRQAVLTAATRRVLDNHATAFELQHGVSAPA